MPYIGGTWQDGVNGLALEDSGRFTIVGEVVSMGVPPSTSFPWTPGAAQTNPQGGTDAFLARFDPSLPASQQLLYSTFLGGSAHLDLPGDVKLDAQGRAVVVGGTLSTNFPATAGSHQPTLAGGQDFFITRLDPIATPVQRLGAHSPACGPGMYSNMYPQPTAGGPLRFDCSGAPANQFGFLLLGQPAPTGIPVPFKGQTLTSYLNIPAKTLATVTSNGTGFAMHTIATVNPALGPGPWGFATQWVFLDPTGCLLLVVSDALSF